MGRPSMSAEDVARNKVRIINAAIDMIREGGIASVTARPLASRIGMNSALIYRYFSDIEEVVLFACVHVLHDYNSEMTAYMAEAESSDNDLSEEDIYLMSWELFSKHAFQHPDEYITLFFSKHSDRLPEVIKEYYQLFPRHSTGSEDVIIEGMYRTANLRSRNLMVLIPVLEGRMSEKDIIIVNDMTVSYFYALLTQLTGNDHKVSAGHYLKRMMDAVRFTLMHYSKGESR